MLHQLSSSCPVNHNLFIVNNLTIVAEHAIFTHCKRNRHLKPKFFIYFPQHKYSTNICTVTLSFCTVNIMLMFLYFKCFLYVNITFYTVNNAFLYINITFYTVNNAFLYVNITFYTVNNAFLYCKHYILYCKQCFSVCKHYILYCKQCFSVCKHYILYCKQCFSAL